MKRKLSFLLIVLLSAVLPLQKVGAQSSYYVINDNSSFEYDLPKWLGRHIVSEGDTIYVSGLKDGVTSFSLQSIPKEVTVVWVHYKAGMIPIGMDPIERDTFQCRVAGIEYEAFKDCASLTSASLPSHIAILGAGAFENCTNLTSASIPQKVTYIPQRLFKGCTRLSGLTIPNGVTGIGDSAFEGCSQLSNLSLSNAIERIGERAFADCVRLTRFSSPSSLIFLGKEAFAGCTGLTSVSLGENLETVGASAFYKCSSLKTVEVLCGSKPVTIGSSAFAECPAIERVTAKSLERWLNISFYTAESNPVSVSHNLYVGTSLLETLTVPHSVTKINNYAFYGATCMKRVVMNSSRDHVMTIGKSAFGGCTGLEKVTVPRMDYWCDIEFANPEANPLSYARHLWTPPSTTHANGEEITRLEIPGNVKSIKDYAFYNATALERIEIGGNVSEIGNNAFLYSMPTRVYSHIISPPVLPANAFSYEAYSTAELVVPNRVFTSGPYANSTEIYQNTKYWYNFKTIRPIGHYDFEEDPTMAGTATAQLTITVSGSGSAVYNNTMVANTTKTFTFNYSTWEGADLEISLVPDRNSSVKSLTVNGQNFMDEVKDNKLLLTAVNYDVDVQVTFAGGISFADATVESICLKNWDTDGNGELSMAEAAAVKDIGTLFSRSKITSFNELQYFSSLKSIDQMAFAYCTALKSVVLPQSLEDIGSAAFTSCESLKEITIPASVTGFGYSPFSYCYSLEKITVAEGNKNFCSPSGSNAITDSKGNYLYVGCNTTVIPPTVTQICQGAFMGMRGLTAITIPPSVELIDQEAFCATGLKEIDIPATVDVIWGAYTIAECPSLKKVTVHWTEPIELPYGNPFYLDEDRIIATLYVPAGTKALYASADGWSEFNTIIELPVSPTGDLNGNGVADANDVVTLVNMMISGRSSSAADLNNDRKVNIADIIELVNIITGK
jgi:hypothetical protein